MGPSPPPGRSGSGLPLFSPRHVLLTGAAGAIGGALARTLAARHPELRFSLVDQDAARLEPLGRELSGRSVALPWDLADLVTLPRLWESAVAQSGEIDLLVNCAGFMEIRSFAATPWELGERLLQVDLISPLRLMNLAVSALRGAALAADSSQHPAHPSGSRDPGGPGTVRGWIVNISSMAGRVPLRGCSYYGAAKAGLATASQVAGWELAAAGIHVLTVLPGPVRSGLESRARAQVKPGLVSRCIPTGDAVILAERIERALVTSRRRLVYPAFYGLADRLVGTSSWLAENLGPAPTDAP